MRPCSSARRACSAAQDLASASASGGREAVGAEAPSAKGGKSKTPALDSFGRDLTDLAKQKKLDPVIGREREIERAIQVLCRRTKNNPVLLGEAGVGKTEVAKILAALLDTDLIRLQCYEGLEVHHAVYEWNYTRQMMHIRLLESRGEKAAEAELFGEEFLLRRPLLQAIELSKEKPPVLLIDELDRSDEEFEALLGTPSDLDLRAAAELFGLGVEVAEDPAALRRALAGDAQVVIVPLDRRRNVDVHRRLSEVAAAALAAA